MSPHAQRIINGRRQAGVSKICGRGFARNFGRVRLAAPGRSGRARGLRWRVGGRGGFGFCVRRNWLRWFAVLAFRKSARCCCVSGREAAPFQAPGAWLFARRKIAYAAAFLVKKFN